MMNINSMDRTNHAMQMGQKNFLGNGKDSVSKGIQGQIENAQKQLQELSSNKEMSTEEKIKKQQEIREQINDLNKQLRQHQIDQRKEMQEMKQPSKDGVSNKKQSNISKVGSQGTGFSKASMTAMISADSALSQAKNCDHIATQMEGQKNVLAMEIKLDAQRGKDVTKKQGDMQDLEERIMKTEASQIAALNMANQEMEEATKTDQQREKTEGKEKTKQEKASNSMESVDSITAGNGVSENTVVSKENETSDILAGIYYTKIDVLL